MVDTQRNTVRIRHLASRHPDRLIGLAIFLFTLILYMATLAPGLVFGDPAEYTFVPHIWGISHPPGYAFQTVLGGIWQRLIPIGTIAYRANLLSAAAGAGIAALIYGCVRMLSPDTPAMSPITRFVPGALAAMSAATAADIWQHSIHANSHIITVLLATSSLFTLIRWWKTGNIGWLYTFCVLAGLSVTHHPLLVFSFPAYIVFILAVQPRIVPDWRTLLKMAGFALLGLSIWLYLPLRASLPAPVPFGPDNTDTLNGFLDLVLARGLRVNLFYFGLADQPDRWLVFWSLLQLQVGLVVIALMVAGLIWLWRMHWRVGLLFTIFLGVNILFIINTIQDVMAYLMTPFAALIALSGPGAVWLLSKLRLPSARDNSILQGFIALFLLGLPASRILYIAPLISLGDYRAADAWIEEVYARFEGQGEHAVLLAHWEHLTPLWYEAWVEGHPLDEEDLTLVFVATTSERPWVDNTWANIEKGPIYVSGYQRELIDESFRLRPVGPTLYRVLPPPATDVPSMQMILNAEAGQVTLVGIDLPVTEAEPGGEIPLSIALRADQLLSDIIFPVATLGDVTYQFTTDSHLLSPSWQPGETIVERYDLRAPLNIEPGKYPLELGLRNLSQGGELSVFPDGSTTLRIGTISIVPPRRNPVDPNDLELLADINHEIGLLDAEASANGQRRSNVWSEPLVVQPGSTIRLQLAWMAINTPGDNYKVFVHLVDSGYRAIAQQDAPPLGGAFPTWLWFSKWIPGQSVIDPYRLIVPMNAPPGDYHIAVGLYGFTTFQRAPFYDVEGNLFGDFFILGPVRVEL